MSSRTLTTRKNKSKRNTSRKTGGNSSISMITFSSNSNNEYKEVGIAHVTAAQGINFLRSNGTEIMNLFGKKGFDTSVHDSCREEALDLLSKKLTSKTQKICDVKIDVETNASLVIVHAYGTIYDKMKV